MENQSYESRDPREGAAPGTTPDPRLADPGRAGPTPDPYYRQPAIQKSTFLAGLLSGLFPGLGQVYCGYYTLGFIYMAVMAGTITVLSSGASEGMEPLFGIFIGFFYIYNIIDAVRRATFHNRAMAGLAAGELPPDAQMPSPLGSLTGGVILIVLGGLLFLNTKFDFSLEWLDEWWPLGMVALGVYLVRKARAERSTSS